MQGIRVTDRFDEQDYVCEKLQHFLTNWETCCLCERRMRAQLLAALRYCMGGYYKRAVSSIPAALGTAARARCGERYALGLRNSCRRRLTLCGMSRV
ncbi:MAG: hypothetical protein ACLRL6_01350 [Clostridium sp.]